ncbi:sodium pump decarboxylase gamma subunit [Halanaerobium saccharolyticum]|uniref:Sodium pump decarboxylase gamma subunit n=1 Tax=Halanaerobium saccharolyticum TaxID=43595 RepID=A0A4R7Z2N6_9FIRM|nr:OadG family protein [Halanaerobium saccharolyticum]RAK03919.1 sodium pump decarboxylase gamma subunit [Halanaerobium saccharolyticum]TDW04441.1 sodium pump decarboxylase gamma subunit [Halanaerobium saccharolyticum]TDX59777.1 sodium pump decarboxylase gamma subunit [Halanaerobium saccharolyticum]
MNNYVLGLELLVIGMGTVFLSLYLLSVFLHFSGKLFGPDSKDKKKNKKTVKNSKSAAENKAVQLDESEQGISPKKVAAVTAAISEMLNNQKNYKIISIQKSNQNWKR